MLSLHMGRDPGIGPGAEECQLKCVKRGGGGCRGLEGKTFKKREKNKGNSIILFFILFNFFSLFYFFLCVYVGGKKKEGGGRLFLEHIPDSPFFFFSWAAIPVCCKVI